MWSGLDLGLGLEYRVKIGVRVKASVYHWGLSIEYRVSPSFGVNIVYPFIRCQRLGLSILLHCVVRNEVDGQLVPILGLLCKHGWSS